MKKTVQIISHTFWTGVIFLFLTTPIAHAASNCGGSDGGLNNPLKSICSFEDFVVSLLQAVTKIGLPIAAVFIMYSGFLFVTAQGNVTKIDEAKKTFFYTIIGVTIFLGAWALALIVDSTIDKLLTG